MAGSEQRTRVRLIDPRLRRAGWGNIVLFVPGLDPKEHLRRLVKAQPIAVSAVDEQREIVRRMSQIFTNANSSLART